MTTEQDISLIEDYLANRLSDAEKEAFEVRLKTDKSFSEAYSFQQAVIKGIQNARIAELKAMLNQVPVGSSSISSTAIKAIVGVSITAVISTISYFVFVYPNSEEVKSTAIEEVLVPKAENQTEATEVVGATENKNISTQHETEPPSIQQNIAENKIEKRKKAANNEIKEGKVVEPKIEIFDPLAEDGQATEEPMLEDKPEEDVFTKSNTLKTEVQPKDRRHSFHYQIEGDQLKLYGPFEKELYEVLEFFSNDKRTAFLYYNRTYYSLAANSTITELKPVMDPKLIQKLEQYRKNQ